MSDPVTNVEIEDVLSSIRRLVSENAKASSPEALVLTPQDRVVSQTVPAPKMEPVTPPRGQRVSLRAEQVQRKEPILKRPTAEVSSNPTGDIAKPVEDAEVLTPDLPPIPPVMSATVPEIEDAVIEAAETLALEETISHIEANVANQDADWEPDDVFLNDNDPEAMFSPTDSAASGDDAAHLDVELLRELVVDTIREELRGALGEKITRNVRKLVRREIQRAMTNKNFN